jgi:hypothetical protein
MSSFPLADRYARFRDTVFAGLQEAPTRLPGMEAPLTELDLQSLWFAGAFGNKFTSTDGKAVMITDFGVWNSSAGPDFMGCAIIIDGQPLRGDIELDPDVRDWERHAHGANPDYTRVVLHVVLHMPEEARFFTRTADHKEVVQVQVTPALLAADARPNRGLAAARIGRCALPLREMEDARVNSMLESAAQHRLERKSLRLHRCIAAHGREQAILQALAQTLGYRNNQQPFFILAQRLPLKRLLKTAAAQREALLFGVSGFLENVRYEDTTPETRHYLRQLWSEWWKVREECERWVRPQQLLRWKLAATRPGNHPQRRLGALAAMLRVWPQISAPLEDASRWSQSAWRDSLLSLQHDYWNTHYTLLADTSAKPLALIGETRVHEMLANVAYPLLMPERTRLWAEYLELPALLDNQKVRRAVLRLFGGDPRTAVFQRKLHQQQGLLQIYEDFCLEDDSACADCPFPERLKDWS